MSSAPSSSVAAPQPPPSKTSKPKAKPKPHSSSSNNKRNSSSSSHQKKHKSIVLNLDVSLQDIEEVKKMTGCETEQDALECIAAHAEPIMQTYARDIPRDKYFWSPIDKKAIWSLVGEGALLHHQCIKACDDLERFEKWEASKVYEPSQYLVLARYYYFLAQIIRMVSLRRFSETLRQVTKNLTSADLDFMQLLLQITDDKYSQTLPVVPRTKDEFLVSCVEEIASESRQHVSKQLASKALKRIRYVMKCLEDQRAEALKSEELEKKAKDVVAAEKKTEKNETSKEAETEKEQQ